MTKYCRIENNKVVEVFIGDVLFPMHPTLLETWVEDHSGLVQEGWLYDGVNFTEPSPIVPDPITVKQVKEEANRRITESGHDWMVIRSISDGTPVPQEILDYAANIRQDASALENMNPIPQNYKDDSYWTQKPV